MKLRAERWNRCRSEMRLLFSYIHHHAEASYILHILLQNVPNTFVSNFPDVASYFENSGARRERVANEESFHGFWVFLVRFLQSRLQSQCFKHNAWVLSELAPLIPHQFSQFDDSRVIL